MWMWNEVLAWACVTGEVGIRCLSLEGRSCWLAAVSDYGSFRVTEMASQVRTQRCINKHRSTSDWDKVISFSGEQIMYHFTV